MNRRGFIQALCAAAFAGNGVIQLIREDKPGWREMLARHGVNPSYESPIFTGEIATWNQFSFPHYSSSAFFVGDPKFGVMSIDARDEFYHRADFYKERPG